MSDIRAIINRAMTAHRITQTQLEAETGMAQGSISRWLNGSQNSVNTVTADRILSAIEQITSASLSFVPGKKKT